MQFLKQLEIVPLYPLNYFIIIISTEFMWSYFTLGCRDVRRWCQVEHFSTFLLWFGESKVFRWCTQDGNPLTKENIVFWIKKKTKSMFWRHIFTCTQLTCLSVPGVIVRLYSIQTGTMSVEERVNHQPRA